MTFADKPPEGSEVVAGTWWPSDYSGPPLVSMEKEVAEGLGLHVGDTVVVNVLGRDIAAKLANLRKVNWRSFAINFVLVYSPNALKGAPYTELVSASLPSAAPDAELKLMRAVAQEFPNVASVRVREAMESVETLVAKLALAIRAATGVALTTSVLVLAGALAANRRARLADATILKILGATRGRLTMMFLIEYALLGLATAAFGVAAGTLAAYLGRLAHHAVRFRLRLAGRARRRWRGPCDHGRARHDRGLADFEPKASGLPAGIVTLGPFARRGGQPALWADYAETIAEGIAAKGNGRAAWHVEFLLAFSAGVQGPRQGGFKVVNMEIDVHGRPVTFVSTNIVAAHGGFRARGFLHDSELRLSAFEDDVRCNRPCDLGEFKGVAIEAKTLFEVRNIDADRVPHDNAPFAF